MQQEQMMDSGVADSAKALVENQEQVAALLMRISATEEALKHQEGDLASLRSSAPDVPALRAEVEDMLAAIALGEVSADVVEAKKGQLIEAVAATNGLADKLAEHVNTIEGLKRKTAQLAAEVFLLKEEQPALIRRFLNDRIGVVGAQYVRDAKTLIASFERMEALRVMLESAGHVGVLSATSEKLFIGAWHLGAFDGEIHGPNDRVMFEGTPPTGPARRDWSQRIVGAEADRIRSEFGVELNG